MALLCALRVRRGSAVPPPGTIPYEIAALVAHKASVTLSLTYPTSTSLPPPTFITPTPPLSLANLYYNSIHNQYQN